jgi:tRNA threonylcarbamoyladenosine biosynthesis protein TsaB
MMRLLAIETSESVGSVAALSGGNVLTEHKLPSEQGSARSLAPAIEGLLAEVGWRPGDVQGVAVTVGPGSFTGLRVGVTTAKVFAYSVKAEVVGVDTLEAIAAASPPEIDHLAVAMDAQRGQVVAGVFRRGPDGWFSPCGPWQLADLDAWLATLPAGIGVAGPVLRSASRELPAAVRVLDPQYWSPTASAVGRLAARRFASGHRDDLWTLLPRYYRRSAAEEKWERKHGGTEST